MWVAQIQTVTVTLYWMSRRDDCRIQKMLLWFLCMPNHWHTDIRFILLLLVLSFWTPIRSVEIFILHCGPAIVMSHVSLIIWYCSHVVRYKDLYGSRSELVLVWVCSILVSCNHPVSFLLFSFCSFSTVWSSYLFSLISKYEGFTILFKVQNK